MGSVSEYRDRIYKNYGANFQNASETFSVEAAINWGRGYIYYLRGWLPTDRKAAIADVACGGGKLLYLYKHLQYENFIGVDISSEQVALARQIAPQVVEANVLPWLEEHQNAFDLITGFDIVEHLEKPEVLRFLDACYKALKPGGRLVLQTPNAESPWGSMQRYGDFTHEVGFTPTLLARLLRLSNFQTVQSRETGPVPWGYSLFSSIRFLIWRSIRLGLKIWNLAETGSSGSGVFTRVFLITALKPVD